MKFYIYFFLFFIHFSIFSQANDNYLWVPIAGDNQVLKIDKQTNKISQTISFDSNIGPAGAFVDCNSVWIIGIQLTQILQIDKSTGNILNNFKTSASDGGLRDGYIDENYVWLIDSGLDEFDGINDHVHQIHKKTGVEKVFTIGNVSQSMTGDAEFIYVTNQDDDTFSIINKNDKSVQTFSTTTRPSGIAVDENFIWICSNDLNRVVRHNKSDYQIEAIISVGLKPDRIKADKNNLWVTNKDSGTLSQIDKTTDGVINTINIGSNPMDIAMDDNFIWVSIGIDFDNIGPGSVVKIDRLSGQVIHTQSTGSLPMLAGDSTGYYYDLNYNCENILRNYTSVSGKTKNYSHINEDALDNDEDTYFEPRSKSQLKVKLPNKTKLSNSSVKIKILSSSVKLKIKLQRFKNGLWKTVTKKTKVLDSDTTINLGNSINKKAKKWRLKLMNKKINGIRGSYGITEWIGTEAA